MIVGDFNARVGCGEGGDSWDVCVAVMKWVVSRTMGKPYCPGVSRIA